MRFGFHFMDFNIPGEPESIAPTLVATAKTADDVGASWFTVMDHYFQMEQFRTAHDPMLEGYATLAFAAAHTRRVKLGTVVTGVTYRPPGLLAKIVTTLDVLSEGRAFLGIGAAWYEREHLGLGVEFPTTGERFERLEEAIQIALQMWSDDDGPFDGTHFQLEETICVPRPVQLPRPPIVIGGVGERKTLRLVAKYADATNFVPVEPDVAAHKLEVLRGHCDAEDRDFDEIEKTILGPPSNPLDDVDGFLASAERYSKLGFEHIHVRPWMPDPSAFVADFGERIAPRLADIG